MVFFFYQHVKVIFKSIFEVVEAQLLQAREEDGLKLGLIDIKRACFYAKAKRDMLIKLPGGDYEPGVRGKLSMSMYGARFAASNWGDGCMEMLGGYNSRVALRHLVSPDAADAK